MLSIAVYLVLSWRETKKRDYVHLVFPENIDSHIVIKLSWVIDNIWLPDKRFQSWEVLTAEEEDKLLDQSVINFWKIGCCTYSITERAPCNKSSTFCYHKKPSGFVEGSY